MIRVNVPLVFSLWNTQMTNAELAAAIGVKESYLHSIRVRFKLPRRWVTKPDDESPTADEIRARAAEVRRGWSEEERAKRAVGSRRRHWRPPSYDYDHKHSVFVPQ